MDISTLGIAVDTTGLVRGQRALDAVGSSARSAADSADGASRKLSAMDRASNDAAQSLFNLGTALKAYVSLQAAQEFLRAADAITTLNNQLRLAEGSARGASRAFESLYDIAQSSRVSFASLGDVYAKVARAGSEIGISQSRLLTVTQSIGNAMTISGGSASSMNAALVQLSQGLASGTLRGEELNSVMEQTPRLARAIADGLGVPIGKLREMGAAGELTAQQVIKALESQAAVLAGEVTSSTVTVGQAMTQMQNATIKAIGEFDRITGTSEKAAAALGGIATGIESLGRALKDNETLIVTVMGALTGAGAVAGGAALIAKLGGVAGAVSGVSAAVGSLSALLLANPLTAVLLGLTAAGAAGYAYSNAQRDTIKGIENQIKALQAEIAQGPSIYGRNAEGMERWRQQVAKTREEIKALQLRLAEKQAAGLDTSAEDARLGRQNAMAKERNDAEAKYAALIASTTTVNAKYVEGVRQLQELRAAGLITDEQVALGLDRLREKYISQRKVADEYQAARKKAASELEDLRAYYALLAQGQPIEEARLRVQLARSGALPKEIEAIVQATKANKALEDSLGAQTKALEAGNREMEAAAQAHEEYMRRYISQRSAAEAAATAEAQALAQQAQTQREANNNIGASTAALSVLTAEREIHRAAMLEEQAAQADLSADGALLAQRYREQAQALRELAAARLEGAAKQTRREENTSLEALLKKDFGADFSKGFDQASASLGTFVQTFRKLIEAQDEFARARVMYAGDQAKLDKIAQAEMNAQASLFGTMAGAAKGFFREGTAGYEALHTAEKIFRAFELAVAVKNAAVKLGLIATETTASVAGQGVMTGATVAGETARTAAKVPGIFASFMSFLGPFGVPAAIAAMAAVGIAAGNRGGGAPLPTNRGTGTVLGDPQAQSESINKSLDLLDGIKSITGVTLGVNRGMLDALRSIDAALGGVTSQVVRSGVVGSASAGVNVGSRRAIDLPLLISPDPLGLFRNSVSLGAQGVVSGPQTVGSASRGGVNLQTFADVTEKDRFLGVAYNTNTYTQYGAVGQDIKNQFGLVVKSLRDSVVEAAVALGNSRSFSEAMADSFSINLGRIDLAGLNGEQINERLKAVFGAAGDNLAAYVQPGLERFQKVGEGYLETVVRVASSTAAVRDSLQSLGSAMYISVDAAQGLITAFGGLENLQTALGGYFDDFYTEEERRAITTRNLQREMQALGLTLPTTRDGFRALVDAQNLNTEAGQAAYATLIDLSAAFAEITETAEDAIAAQKSLAEMYATSNDDYLARLSFVQNGGSLAEPNGVAVGYSAGFNQPRPAGDQIAETRALRQDLRDSQAQVAALLAKINKVYQRWDVDGLPATRTN